MRYLLLMYRDEKWWDAKPEQERTAIRQQAVDAAEALRRRGIYVAGHPLLRVGGHSIEVRPIRELPPRAIE